MSPAAWTGSPDPRLPPPPARPATGQPQALDQALPLVYNELRLLARQLLRRRRRQPVSDDTTSIVHEAYLRLARHPDSPFASQAHFLAVAAKAIRELLVDHARRHGAAKRHPVRADRLLDEGVSLVSRPGPDLLAVDEAVRRLSERDERKGRIVELRFFGGLSVQDTAEVLGVSPTTVRREGTLARAWLRRELGQKSSRR